jgi:hypothetical protein
MELEKPHFTETTQPLDIPGVASSGGWDRTSDTRLMKPLL